VDLGVVHAMQGSADQGQQWVLVRHQDRLPG
jgi:hypothetical protein